jgi:hypothetical protein
MVPGGWSRHTLLALAFRTLFVCKRGYLIRDDTVLPKPSATAIDGLAWVCSRRERKSVWGLSVVFLVWTNGIIRIPLDFRCWRPGGSSKYELA